MRKLDNTLKKEQQKLRDELQVHMISNQSILDEINNQSSMNLTVDKTSNGSLSANAKLLTELSKLLETNKVFARNWELIQKHRIDYPDGGSTKGISQSMTIDSSS